MKAPDFDFVVLGSGIAGLTFALQAAAHGRVLVLCKANFSETNTAYAQGGIAAVLDPTDSFEQHVHDTLEAGAGLCDEVAVRYMVQEAPAAIRWLQGIAVGFDKAASGDMALGLEGGHSHHRVVHVKDHTGRSVQQALGKAVRRHPNIFVQEHQMGIELLTDTSSTGTFCYGVQVLDLHTQEVRSIPAQAVVLATGGSGQVYQYTTNPGIATGDGLAMAARAGADIQHMEFFQFHPTALYQPNGEVFLISEALRGAGAELVLPDGSRFMHLYHPLGSLAPRDIVARAVLTEMQRHQSPCLYLDVRHLPAGKVRENFPSIYHKCTTIGIDIEKELIPIVSAAHYQCGGVKTNLSGLTSIERLYAIGEVACTGVHGANRLASNSLLEGVVFAQRAADQIARSTSDQLEAMPDLDSGIDSVGTMWLGMQAELTRKRAELQKLLWEQAGIVRSVKGLLHCQAQIESLQRKVKGIADLTGIQQEVQELQNLLTVAELITKAALARRESIGGHFITETLPDKRSSQDNKVLVDIPETGIRALF
ncbi:L-aspartate oxidase [Pontibacter sp. HSC-36F09]|uniref:L-aspartate oxidase n=1 Tax=Pontibacter sp. HSC-36F09 TaxID=2910966 RepID=UPI00209EB346|nr:L-aspartate oxidase [Pontibacter sp. HSC-36F09]MCP2045543.1 L-aspartate oxidase [Pontibacter sp. HSC-36F09]